MTGEQTRSLTDIGEFDAFAAVTTRNLLSPVQQPFEVAGNPETVAPQEFGDFRLSKPVRLNQLHPVRQNADQPLRCLARRPGIEPHDDRAIGQLDIFGKDVRRDVEPGEMVRISRNGIESIRFAAEKPRTQCVFEHVYFSRPDSRVFGRSVNESRDRMGRILAREHPVDADVVVPVPDSGVPAAIGYANESGIPFSMALIRNHYIGRTFIEPAQSIRNWVAQADQRHCEQLVDDLNDKQCLCPSGDVAIEKMQGDQSCAGEQNGCVDRRKYPSRRHIGAPSKFCRLAVRANRDQHRDEYKDV